MRKVEAWGRCGFTFVFIFLSSIVPHYSHASPVAGEHIENLVYIYSPLDDWNQSTSAEDSKSFFNLLKAAETKKLKVMFIKLTDYNMKTEADLKTFISTALKGLSGKSFVVISAHGGEVKEGAEKQYETDTRLALNSKFGLKAPIKYSSLAEVFDSAKISGLLLSSCSGFSDAFQKVGPPVRCTIARSDASGSARVGRQYLEALASIIAQQGSFELGAGLSTEVKKQHQKGFTSEATDPRSRIRDLLNNLIAAQGTSNGLEFQTLIARDSAAAPSLTSFEGNGFATIDESGKAISLCWLPENRPLFPGHYALSSVFEKSAEPGVRFEGEDQSFSRFYWTDWPMLVCNNQGKMKMIMPGSCPGKSYPLARDSKGAYVLELPDDGSLNRVARGRIKKQIELNINYLSRLNVAIPAEYCLHGCDLPDFKSDHGRIHVVAGACDPAGMGYFCGLSTVARFTPEAACCNPPPNSGYVKDSITGLCRVDKSCSPGSSANQPGCFQLNNYAMPLMSYLSGSALPNYAQKPTYTCSRNEVKFDYDCCTQNGGTGLKLFNLVNKLPAEIGRNIQGLSDDFNQPVCVPQKLTQSEKENEAREH